MDKRFQLFISSTFRDLVEERQSVLKAILELDQMPAGMELFAAGDDEAWQLIQGVIAASDYVILIIGGRYGSLDTAGIGYTEREYDYAVSQRKPIIPLLHRTPDALPRERTETDPAGWAKLQAFRQKVEARHTCAYWHSAEDLKAKVIVGLTSAMKRYPAIGWLRADQVPSDATIAEVSKLRQRVSLLEGQLEVSRTQPPESAKDLAQGSDLSRIKYQFVARKRLDKYPHYKDTGYSSSVEIPWNDLFAAVAPSLINEATDAVLRRSLRTRLTEAAQSSLVDAPQLKELELREFAFSDSELDTSIIQFRALGLIRVSDKARSVKDTGTYWALTPYGDFLMTQLRALRRPPTPPQPTGDNTPTLDDIV